MIDNLFDFGDEKLQSNYQANQSTAEQSAKDTLGEDEVKNAQDIYEKYKDYNQDDLAKELFEVTKRQKENGTLDNQKINSTAKMLKPYLNDSQKQFLDSIIGKINNE